MSGPRSDAVCEKDPKHAGPFYQVFVIARQCGPGTRGKGKKRNEARLPITRLCQDCLRVAGLRFEGKQLLALDPREAKNETQAHNGRTD